MKREFKTWESLWSMAFLSALCLVLAMLAGAMASLLWQAAVVGWRFSYWLLT